MRFVLGALAGIVTVAGVAGVSVARQLRREHRQPTARADREWPSFGESEHR